MMQVASILALHCGQRCHLPQLSQEQLQIIDKLFFRPGSKLNRRYATSEGKLDFPCWVVMVSKVMMV
jgi:hypothetical protein